MIPMFESAGLVQNAIFVVLGAAFGFFMERGGFSDSRKLAAQFYFGDMRVFKVMFSAIIVASILLFASASMGLVNLDAMYVNPTYLGTAIVGGLALGAGFIIGGWCPGTSMVGLATGKLDAMVFVLGLLLGTFVFGSTVPSFWEAYHTWGAYGHFTLPEFTGLSTGAVLIAVLGLASFAFFLTEKVERFVGEQAGLSPRQIAVTLGGAAGLAGLSALVLVLGEPTVAEKVARQEATLAAPLAAREVQMDPGEVLKLMSEFKVPVRIADVRSPSEFNMFHLKDSELLPPVEEQGAWLESLTPGTVVILVGNGEDAATAAWKQLMVQKAGKPLFTPYLLEGGINKWAHAYGKHTEGMLKLEAGVDSPSFRFEAPVGATVELARPDLHHAPEREYTPKFKMAAKKGGGGCG